MVEPERRWDRAKSKLSSKEGFLGIEVRKLDELREHM
jgi:heme-degrading monooxygenase HmoA